MEKLIGLCLLALAIFAVAFFYNKVMDRDLAPYYDAIISDKLIKTLKH